MKDINVIKLDAESQRVDVWLWHARIYKSRSISIEHIRLNIIRLNSHPINKPATKIKINDILTFPWHQQVKVIQILNLTKQRISAKNISLIYKEILEKE